MNLFRQHSQENEAQAKAALTSVCARTIGRYIHYQSYLNKCLSGGGRTQKDGDCLMCLVNKVTMRMSMLECQVGQITKTWKLMFGTDMDVESITEDMTRKFYPMTRARTRKEKEEGVTWDENGGTIEGNNGIHFPADMPEDLKKAFGRFAESLNGEHKGDFEMHVIDGRRGAKHGLRPMDFESPEDFFDAVKKAEKSEGKPGEEVIKEAVLSRVDKLSSNGTDKSKRTRKGLGDDKKPKLN